MGTLVTDTPDAPPKDSADGELAAGEQVGEYTIEERIGKGGFGTVYRAIHPLIGKVVAIKVLARRFSADDTIVSRFVAEARAVNQIRHHNIIDIFAFSRLPDGRHYYVMEHLEGESLDRVLAERGAIPLDEALPILRGIARALDAAHGKGIAHRDLKPENIMLTRDAEGRPFPKLLDFGIAKLLGPEVDVKHKTGTGIPIGTPYYMSPEQARGREVDHRTDVYSFGVLAYRVLTGTNAFEGADYMDLLMKQMNDEPPPPSQRNPTLPPSIDQAIAWMMSKLPAERPATVTEGMTAIDPTSGLTPSIPPRSTRRSLPPGSTAGSAPTEAWLEPPKSRGVWIAGLAVLALAAGIVAVVVTRSDETPGKPAAAPAVAVAAEPVDAAPPPAIADAAPGSAAASHVIVTITGAPPDTKVSVAGRPVGVAPGDVQLERGSTDVVLTLAADGHLPATLRLTPDRDQTKTVKLDKRRRPRTTPADSRDTTIDASEVFKRKVEDRQ